MEALNFRGFVEFTIERNIDRNKGISWRWNVLSLGRRSILVDYLWGKFLWDELTKFEKEVFFTLPEITKEKSIYLGLKALAFGISKSEIRERLEYLSNFGFIKFITRQQYLSIKGQVKFVFIEEKFTLQKSPKYSGYTKHYKDKGTLTKVKPEMISELTEYYYDENNDELLFHFLTVGDIILLSQWMYFLPDDGPKKVRNSDTNL
jgi:hypothetical protein